MENRLKTQLQMYLHVIRLDSGSSRLGSSAGRDHCVVFFIKTLLKLSQCLVHTCNSSPRNINGLLLKTGDVRET